MATLRVALPRGRALAGALVFGLLQFGATYALAYYALVELHAGFGQIILALVPLMTLLLVVAQRQEHVRLAAVAGSFLALTGVVIMSRAPLEGTLPRPGLVVGGLLVLGGVYVGALRAPTPERTSR